jgi:hypothetical protein
MFAALIIERPPLDWGGLGGALGQWLRDAGLYAFIWLCLLGLSYLLVPEFRKRSPWSWLHRTMLYAGIAAVILGGVFLVMLASSGTVDDPDAPKSTEGSRANAPPPQTYRPEQKLVLSIAGAICLLAVVLPLARDVSQKRVVWRRIWAISRLSIKEAWSRGIVWVCVIIPLIYLYADWYISAKPEDMLRNRIGIAYFSMAVLFVLSAILLGSFSIPADIRNQTMFTIVTKPVERYEIVLGRFLGFAVLLLAQLAVLSVISYVYVVRGLTEQAREESYHARVPLFGKELYFHNTSKREVGENVGREWNYRSYITGPNPQDPQKRTQFAVWAFDSLPGVLEGREEDVQLEFTFDIFRTTTGLENKGVFCTFTVAQGDLTAEEVDKLLLPTNDFAREMADLEKKAVDRNKASGKSKEEQEKLNEESRKQIRMDMFKKRGVYQFRGIEVTDYHTQVIKIPGPVLAHLYNLAKETKTTEEGKPAPAMQIFVNVQDDPYSRAQLVGMAKPDLYLLVADRPFWINFFKGALSIYLIACVVLGLAVVFSTYMSGIISLLLTTLLCLGGLFLPFIHSLAEGRSDGGGPGEAMYRLASRQPGAVPLDRQSATIDVLLKADAFYRAVLRTVLNLIPDVSQFYMKDYVANGFDITYGPLLFLNIVLPVLGYVLPWLLLAYYLMMSREIANP